ncbi:dolichyl-phosphate-mannose-protein mannosyltransferase [Afipia carboxidovorans OM5]|uniref:Putative glycosyltransferase n=1 Tax=Afipia carboxidovorans (strain ATCC 49405 / DSM 1227 / KCTC 32145 / OM5) TaxID=504832 RepID=B6JGS2_AFIC5|nr:glycosyltransferase family 39 protein [Afipia carboxidovorans]ACI93006.1 dolichyl-phosphate-mannose-protein mannosyltransferase [Afipia carboxidovorans OM5]AEI03263.1 putative glycosyltransferase [Afipia carboxidovorans OM4]AEI06840.1 putative glycosyltransferase [Afipia carboxidovorans OM5]
MTDQSHDASRNPTRPSADTAAVPVLIAILLALTAVRLVGLNLSQVDLFFDEAQYWSWAQAPAFGYFSKPPLLAWVIALAQSVCGSGEACVRAPSPIIYALIAIVVYLIAHRLYDARTAFWSALSIVLATGVIFSTRIISTDVPLLLFWSLALLAYVELLEKPRWSFAIVLGLAVGLGMLAKYAMVYFYLGIVLSAWLAPHTRTLLRQPMFWVSVLIAFACLIPNVIWIAQHDFVTFKHTSDNVQGSGASFRPGQALSFLASQFAVIGPITFGVFLVGLAKLWRNTFTHEDRLLIAFAIPPLVLIAGTAMITHYNANWAATAAISVTIFATAILIREARWKLVTTTIALGLSAQTLFIIADAYAPKVSLPFLARGDVYSRTLGWKNLAEAVKEVTQKTGAKSIVTDQRAATAELLYYLRDANLPIYAWRSQAAASDQYDMDIPLTPSAPQPVLAVVECGSPARYRNSYDAVEALPDITVSTGPRSQRSYRALMLSGANGTPPFGRCS